MDKEKIIDTDNYLRSDSKPIQECAEEANDLEAMMKYAQSLMNEDIYKARDIIAKAERLHPNNLDVKFAYANVMFLVGHLELRMRVSETQVLDILLKCVTAIDFLKRHNYNPDMVRRLEIDACMDGGQVASKLNKDELVLKMFARTDLHKYPYAIVLLIFVHMKNPYQYAKELSYDIRLIGQALNEKHWRNNTEVAAAYWVLSVLYAHGVPNVVSRNVRHAYECIKRSAAIDYPMAEGELRKYSEDFGGGIHYKS